MSIFIAIFSILFLVVLHELGHFLTAKKFNVEVHEFGIGLPFTPTIFKRKIGETMYSFYHLLIGAFVKMRGEEAGDAHQRSFSEKPIWQRIVIVMAGVLSSWIAAAVIIAIVGAGWNVALNIPDDANFLRNPQVQILGVVEGLPAEQAGVRAGDLVVRVEDQSGRLDTPTTMQAFRDFIQETAGKMLILTVSRDSELTQIELVPRVNPPDGQGSLGVALNRVGVLHFAWWQAPWEGIRYTGILTFFTIDQTIEQISKSLAGQGPPLHTQVTGPVGIISLLGASYEVGIEQFLLFVAQIAILLAIFNTIPIPALDGGRLLFLLIEAVRKKPLPDKDCQISIIISFALLVPLIVWVTINDISRQF